MQILKSYVSGAWFEGAKEGQTLYNPSTGEALARCDSTGMDRSAALSYARTTGGPALRELSFEQRATRLKALSELFYAHREELIDLSMSNGGNTRGDAKFDIDGATGTLAAYSWLGKKMGERAFLTDGPGVQLGRTPRFWGEHIFTPRLGVALHINAFNFPAWGMGEKMACALLAGMPVVEKAGTPSAMLAFRMAELLVDSEILPAGAFSLLVGSVGDLLDHLQPQDCVAFTGSADTARKIKAHPAFVERNARLGVEADSINSAILGPDVDDEDETWNEFLGNIVTDMTQKSGQKCTGVRRIFVPEDRVEAVREELVERLAAVKQGDVSDASNRMGPVASEWQHQDVQAGIRELSEHCDIACGGPEPVGDKGYFIAPTLLVARDSEVPLLHKKEVFGPVSTILPYSGEAAEAIRLANKGGGCLVCSLYTNDRDFGREVVEGIGPWHGRVWIGSDKSAGQAMPPGAVLPFSVHGGPGRAGGGEELGGLRGLEFYMQRTALQGDRGFVGRQFGHAEKDD
jgi:phenylacetic acid degradation protein PaaN